MWRQTANFFANYYLAIISGLLIGTSYIPFPPWAIFFCYLPLWISWIKKPTFKNILISGWITGFILTFIGFHWIANTAHEFGQLPWVAAVPVLMLFCIFNNYFVVVAGVCWWLCQKFLKPPEWISLLLLPLLTVSAETFAHGIFPWHFGYSWLYMNWPGVQLAEYIGFYGLSLIGFVVNWLLMMAWLKRQQRFRLLSYFVTALILITAANLLGYFILKNQPELANELKVLQVQANIGNQDKIRAVHGGRSLNYTIERFFDLTDKNLEPDTDLIVWPETAFPTYLNPPYDGSYFSRRLKRKVRKWQTPLFTGAYANYKQNQKTYNSVFLLDRDGDVGPSYNKTILLAFGEYMPGDKIFPFVRKWIPTISDFAHGDGPSQMAFGDHTIGPQICYEALYPEFSRQLVLNGADVIVNITNDSWFGKHAEPWQHLYMTLARAIEVRRPIVRNTNTGVSTAITAAGEVLELSPIHEEWAGTFRIPFEPSNEHTVFVTWGHRLPLAILLLSLIIAFCGGLIGKIRNQKNADS